MTASSVYGETLSAQVDDLQTDLSLGLGSQVAVERLLRGRNEWPEPPGPSLFDRVLRQAKEPLSVLLLAAALVSYFASGETGDAIAIVAIVLLNIAVAVIQEGRAADALAALKAAAAPTATVVRDGTTTTIPAAELVPGDIVLLAAGDRVPADTWIFRDWSFEVDESLLTGESLSVVKRSAEVGDMTVPLADRTWVAHGGTVVTAGSAHGLVYATGAETAVGRIAVELGGPSPDTPLQRQLAHLSARLGQAAVVVAIAVFVTIVVRLGTSGDALQQAFLAAVALAVAAVPEGLGAVVTLSLALGVRRLAQHGAIVRNLPAVETLGSTTVLLTDKTGTLTQNRMTLAGVVDGEGADFALQELEGCYADKVRRVIVLCNDATLNPPQGDPVEVALLEALDSDTVADLRAMCPRLDSAPFDPARRMMSTLHVVDGVPVLFCKGAPEQVLAACESSLGIDGARRPLTGADRDRISQIVDIKAEQGGRILALATRHIEETPDNLTDIERDLTFLGLAILYDPLRPEAARTVESMRKAGIKLVMVTGDHAGTARSVARQAGIDHGESPVVTGYDMRRHGLPEDFRSVRVFARVDPEQKLALVDAFQVAGEVVAVTGDGVNDAPALQRADIGVAMGRGGSEVAREAADLVITDDDLDLVTRAVNEGRSIYANIRKVVDYLVAGNSSEVLVVLIGLVWFPALGVPLLPVQLLWINLLTDGLPALALGFDTPRAAGTARPSSRAQLLSPRRLALLGFRGTVLAAGAITALALTSAQGDWEEARTVMFTTLVVSHLLYAYVVRIGEAGTNPRLAIAVILGLALQVGAVLGPFAATFAAVPLSYGQWVTVVVCGTVPVFVLAAIEWLRRLRRL